MLLFVRRRTGTQFQTNKFQCAQRLCSLLNPTPSLTTLFAVSLLTTSPTIAQSQVRYADGTFWKMERAAKSPECLNPEQAKTFINFAEGKLFQWRDNTMVYDDNDNSLETSDAKELIDKIKQKICPPKPVKLYHVGVGPKPKLFDPVPPSTSPSDEDPQKRTEIGSARRTWTGFYAGGAVGARGTNNNVTNQNQITVLVPDQIPNPTASINGSGIYGNFVFGYNSIFPMGGPIPNLLVGVEGFIGVGSNSSTGSGVPGTGGIATPAVMANDSTTVKETWDAGILGRIGTIVPMGNTPVSLSILGGVGFLQVKLDANCTAAGACGTNGIPAQTLSTSKTMTGSLIGFEVGMPLATVLTSQSAPRILRTANIRAQFLHGDFGHVSTPVGNPAQIQIMFDQKVTTNTLTIGLIVPFSGYDEIDRSKYTRLDHKF